MTFDASLVTVQERPNAVALVTLNDPERRNAMTAEMGDSLSTALQYLADTVVRSIVLTGAPPAFSGGGDLAMLEEHARQARAEEFNAEETMRKFYERFLVVRRSAVPVIAAVNGHAIGAGLCVALACDLVLVAEKARMGLNFTRVGMHPGMGGSWFLPRLAGPQRAAELLYTGRVFTGSEAASYGLALDAFPADDVVDQALVIADEIARSSPVAVRQLKRNLREVETRSLDEQLDREAAAQAVNYTTDDAREGLAAARERRNPDFS